jgi:hypothetical protein
MGPIVGLDDMDKWKFLPPPEFELRILGRMVVNIYKSGLNPQSYLALIIWSMELGIISLIQVSLEATSRGCKVGVYNGAYEKQLWA